MHLALVMVAMAAGAATELLHSNVTQQISDFDGDAWQQKDFSHRYEVF